MASIGAAVGSGQDCDKQTKTEEATERRGEAHGRPANMTATQQKEDEPTEREAQRGRGTIERKARRRERAPTSRPVIMAAARLTTNREDLPEDRPVSNTAAPSTMKEHIAAQHRPVSKTAVQQKDEEPIAATNRPVSKTAVTQTRQRHESLETPAVSERVFCTEKSATEAEVEEPEKNTQGGDPWCCLTDREILTLLPPQALLFPPSLCFDIMRGSARKQQLIDALSASRNTKGHCIFWCRHHWIAGEVFTKDGRMRIRCWDSAPCLAVRRDLRRLLPGTTILFPLCPKQSRGSNECGLFAAGFVTLARLGHPIPSSDNVVSLSHLRRLVAYTDENTSSRFAHAVVAIFVRGSSQGAVKGQSA